MNLGRIVTGFSMSLDGFIADSNDDVSRLFGWYGGGDTEVKMPGWPQPLQVSAASARHIREVHLQTGALVTGRRQYDLTQGWGGRHPLDVPVFVVTHEVPSGGRTPNRHRALDAIQAKHQSPSESFGTETSPFTFVTEGVERAIELAQAAAGSKNVAVDGASIVQQAIRAGLVDEIGIDLIPVLLGAGVRYFDRLGSEPIELERTHVIEAPGVTHLRFRVIK